MKTIICAQFKQESNRYAKGVSGLKEYMEREYLFGEDQLRNAFEGARNEIGGFFHVLDQEPDCMLVPIFALNASPGPVTDQIIWDQVREALLNAIETLPCVDGVLLALHGAMVTEEMEDGEGELLQVLRDRLGPDIPIVATLDLHANMTQKMMDHATAFFPCDYYPHTDFFEAGVRAARCIWQTVNGEVRPIMKWKKMDMLFPYVLTQSGPFVPLLRKAQSWREMGTLLNASICHGFFAGDIYEQGAAILTVSDGNGDLAQSLADELAEDVWDARELLNRHFYTPEEAVALAMQAEQGPVVLADVADNPGSGATTDSVLLLRLLLEAGAADTAVAVIYDPQVVQQAEQAGVGASINVELGGKLAPEITGGPLLCRAKVAKLTDGRFRNRDQMNQGVEMLFGNCAVLLIDGIHVIVCSNHTQPYDLEIYRHCGIKPEQMRVLVVKSAVHYRASFGTVAKQILDVETPALGPMNPKMLPLAHSRRPIYPLDELCSAAESASSDNSPASLYSVSDSTFSSGNPA